MTDTDRLAAVMNQWAHDQIHSGNATHDFYGEMADAIRTALRTGDLTPADVGMVGWSSDPLDCKHYTDDPDAFIFECMVCGNDPDRCPQRPLWLAPTETATP